jgi:hypothetical protein
MVRWRKDPAAFVREVFHATPDNWQADVLHAFPTTQRIAMQASKGVGKSTIMAWCCWNFLATRPHPKVIVTSISGDNLADGLFSELAFWYAKSPFLKAAFEMTKTRIVSRTSPDTWFCSARSWSKSADSSQQANSLAGIHSDYVLFVLDEVGGIPDSVMSAAEAALASGVETKLLIGGNPTHLSGPLYRAATSERHLWKVVCINSDPDDPNRSTRVSAQWAREQLEKYGRDSPWNIVNVFGRFPPASINSLLGPDEVREAMGRHLREDEYNFAQKRLGVDVARFGTDSTVIFPRQGLAAFTPVRMQGANGPEVAARIMAAKAKWGSEVEFVDDTGGFGSSVIDSLIQAGQSPFAVHFSSKATDPRYYNKRSEMHFLMAEWIKRGGALPNIPELARELTTPTYTFHNGKLRIEEKDAIKERLGCSPDYSDALATTFFLVEMPAKTPWDHLTPNNNFKSDYDPFSPERLND